MINPGGGRMDLQGPWRRFNCILSLVVMACLCMGVNSEQKEAGNFTLPNSGTNGKLEKEVEPEEEVSDELRLVRHLLQRYKRKGTIARPVYNSSKPITVSFGLRLMQLELDEKEQLMKTSMWLRVRWTDEYLRWNPDDFGGIEKTILPCDKVWTPDIVLVNTVSGSEQDDMPDISIYHLGFVFWAPHRMFESACLIDISNFPYDYHRCEMWFQSKSYFANLLDLKPYPWSLETYMDSYEKSQGWEIIHNEAKRIDPKTQKATILKFNKRPALQFSLTVKRRPGYNCHVLMLPCIFLGALTLLVFCLPPDGADRIALAMSLFASFIVLLLILVEAAPPVAGAVPKLGLYYAANIALVIASIFLSALIIAVAGRGKTIKKPVPRLLRIIFLDLLSRPMLLHGQVLRVLGPRRPNNKLKNGDAPCQTATSTMDGFQSVEQNAKNGEFGLDGKEDGQVHKRLLSIEGKLNRLESNLIHSAGQPDESDEQAYQCQEWLMVSQVIDRLCFIISVVVFILSAVLFFPRPSI